MIKIYGLPNACVSTKTGDIIQIIKFYSHEISALKLMTIVQVKMKFNKVENHNYLLKLVNKLSFIRYMPREK